MPTLRSHTNLQATSRQKRDKRVCLPNRTNDRQIDDQKEQSRHNSGLAKMAVQCSADTFVVKIANFAKV